MWSAGMILFRVGRYSPNIPFNHRSSRTMFSTSDHMSVRKLLGRFSEDLRNFLASPADGSIIYQKSFKMSPSSVLLLVRL